MISAIICIAVGVAFLVIAVRIIAAIFPYLLGGAAILFALVILGAFFSENGSHYSYNRESSRTASAEKQSEKNTAPVYRERNAEQARFHAEAIGLVLTKDGNVNLSTLQPAMDSAIVKIDEAFSRVMGTFYIPTVTSGDDYEGHCHGSAHYSGAALDYRLKDIDDPYLREMVTVAVREALGDRFFVDHEAPGEENEHLHVQLRKGTYKKIAWR